MLTTFHPVLFVSLSVHIKQPIILQKIIPLYSCILNHILLVICFTKLWSNSLSTVRRNQQIESLSAFMISIHKIITELTLGQIFKEPLTNASTSKNSVVFKSIAAYFETLLFEQNEILRRIINIVTHFIKPLH